MRLTSKGRYAVRAMLDLTLNGKKEIPVRLHEISRRQNISLHYLEQLFRKLRNGGVVKSVRGPGGGYILGASQDEISIKKILQSVGENINPAKDIIGPESELANTKEYELSKNYFSNLGTIMKEYLETTTLGDLARNYYQGDAASKSVSEALLNGQTKNSSPDTVSTNEPTKSVIRSPGGPEFNQ